MEKEKKMREEDVKMKDTPRPGLTTKQKEEEGKTVKEKREGWEEEERRGNTHSNNTWDRSRSCGRNEMKCKCVSCFFAYVCNLLRSICYPLKVPNNTLAQKNFAFVKTSPA